MDCGALHRELPDDLYPYKQYEAEVIRGVLEGLITCETLGFEDYPCEMTIRDNGNSVESGMTTVLTNTVTAINNTKGQFTEAGKNVGQGFVNGINSKLSSATAAGRSLGLAALNAAKKAVDSHSPSREFIHLGEYMGEGLAIGVNNSIVPAAQATSDMIGEVVKVSKKVLTPLRIGLRNGSIMENSA